MDQTDNTDKALMSQVRALQQRIVSLEEEISRRKETCKTSDIEENMEMFRVLAESSPSAIMRFDRQFRHLYINATVEKMLSLPHSAVIGKTHAELSLPREVVEKWEEAIGRVFAEKTPQRIEIEFPSGSWIDGMLVPEFTTAGQVNAAIISAQDMTERKRTESQWLESQKLEAIGTLADGIAHEFNNILMGIQGYVSLMHYQKDGKHSQDDKLQNIENLIEKGANLTKQLLGFAQSGMYEVCPTDINFLLDESVKMFGRTKREISIHRNLQQEVWMVAADRGQLDQVFMNLYINAWQAMPAGGNLYIETHNMIVTEDDAESYSLQAGRYVEIVVRDTGVGMDESTRSRIFDPFFTTKEMGKGTGLGLAFVYGIVKNHGGMIKIFSERGKGATFRIYLPAVTEEPAAEKDEEGTVAGGMETILVVDDEEININVMEEWLDILGYNVLTARNGDEALDIYRKNANEIHLVLLDMIMPGMNGGEVYDLMKAINPTVRVILSSGYSIDGKATEILQRGIKAFIQKPFRIDSLAQKIREVLVS
ncbi:MAG: response regulator [Syntrophales bacterium]|nr:response regulator [Syntrophales bacterium]